MDLRGVAMVTRAGTVRTELAAGLADAAAGVACTAQTRFQICSISKQFAANERVAARHARPARPDRG
jgi:CubicO group peptidase (beta-lactamase class C family)